MKKKSNRLNDDEHSKSIKINKSEFERTFQDLYEKKLWFSALDYLINAEKNFINNEKVDTFAEKETYRLKKSYVYDRIREMFQEEKNEEFTIAFLMANGYSGEKNADVRRSSVNICLQQKFADAELLNRDNNQKLGVSLAFSSEEALENMINGNFKGETGHYAVCFGDCISVFSFTPEKMIIRSIDCLENLEEKMVLEQSEISDKYDELVETLDIDEYSEFLNAYSELSGKYLEICGGSEL